MKVFAVTLALLVPGFASTAHAGDARFGPNDVRTLFGVAKSTNKNVVEYGIRLDKDCVPVGNQPVYAYWRDHEKGPDVTSDLNVVEETIYGVRGQAVSRRVPDDSKVVMTIKAAADRQITVLLKKKEGRCVAETSGTIASQQARLDQIFVHMTSAISVDWVEICGTANGQPVVERVKH